jgi:hypothetical protein
MASGSGAAWPASSGRPDRGRRGRRALGSADREAALPHELQPASSPAAAAWSMLVIYLFFPPLFLIFRLLPLLQNRYSVPVFPTGTREAALIGNQKGVEPAPFRFNE